MFIKTKTMQWYLLINIKGCISVQCRISVLHIYDILSFDNAFQFFFSGEVFELKTELQSDKKEKKKEAVKKVIASMTVGKDVR